MLIFDSVSAIWSYYWIDKRKCSKMFDDGYISKVCRIPSREWKEKKKLIFYTVNLEMIKYLSETIPRLCSNTTEKK